MPKKQPNTQKNEVQGLNAAIWAARIELETRSQLEYERRWGFMKSMFKDETSKPNFEAKATKWDYYNQKQRDSDDAIINNKQKGMKKSSQPNNHTESRTPIFPVSKSNFEQECAKNLASLSCTIKEDTRKNKQPVNGSLGEGLRGLAGGGFEHYSYNYATKVERRQDRIKEERQFLVIPNHSSKLQTRGDSHTVYNYPVTMAQKYGWQWKQQPKDRAVVINSLERFGNLSAKFRSQ